MWLCALAAHELGHLTAATGLGHTIDQVDIQPFGGVAAGTGPLTADVAGEATVALAGPFSNLLFLALGLAASRWLSADVGMLRLLVDFNLALALFNLLPGLPLDGGRALRSFWCRRLGYARATRRAAALGRVVAMSLLGLAGLALALGQVWPALPVIAVTVWVVSGREAREVAYGAVRQALWRRRSLQRRGLLGVERLVADANVTVDEAVRALVPGRFCIFDVTGPERRVVGSVNENRVLDAYLSGRGFQKLVQLAEPILCHGPPKKV